MGFYDDLKSGDTLSKKSSAASTPAKTGGGFYDSLKSNSQVETQRNTSQSSEPKSRQMTLPDLQETIKAGKVAANFIGKVGNTIGGQLKTAVVDAQARGQAIGEARKAAEAKAKAERAALVAKRKEDQKNLPYGLKKIVQGLDWIGDKTKPAADVALELYTPGAPISAIGAFGKGAESLLSRYLPKLVNGSGSGSKIATTAIREGATGVPLGVGNQLARNPESSNRELLESAALGGIGGALLGGGASAVGQGVKGVANKLVQSGLRPTIETAINAPKAINDAAGTMPQSVRRVVSKDSVPEVFPERFRRTVGTPDSAPIVNDTASVQTPQRAATASQNIQTPRGERANYTTQVREGNFPEEFNRGVAARDRTYDVITDEASVARANEALKDVDVDTATSKFLGTKEISKDHVTTGYRLLQELNRAGDFEKALNVADKLAADLTQSGQAVQAASVLKRLSPEGQLLHLQRQATAAGKTVTPVDAKLYSDLAAEVEQGSRNGAETRAFMDTLDRLKAGEKVSPEELQNASGILKEAEKYLKQNAEFPKAIKDTKVRDRVVSFLDDVEANALARIAARRNNLNSLPVGEWADHALVVSAQIAKGTIKAANYVEQMVKMFGEEIRPHAKQIYDEARRLLGVTAKNINEGNLREAQEAIERVRTSQTPAGKVAEKFIRESEIKPGDVEKIRDLARKLNSLRGASAQEADMQMQAILNRYQKASWWDRTQALRYIAMLFNTGTQSINAISGPIMATTGYAADIAGALMDMAYSAIKNQPRTTTLYGSNPLKFMARWFKNVGPGGKAGFMGVSPHGIMGANDIRGLAFKGTPWNETTLKGKIGGTLSMPFSGLERSLGAVAKGADYATYKSVYQSEMDKLGYLDAKRNGIKGRKEIKAHIEKFLIDPPDSAIDQADKVAKRTTFQRSDTLGGKAANFLNSAPPGVKPVVNTVFPFVRTPVNIASAAVDLSPAGVIKGLVELSRIGGSEAARRDAIRTLGLSLVGGGGLGAIGYYLSQIGIVNGANESGDKNMDAVRDQAGKGKFRFNSSAMGRYLDAMIGGKGLKAAENAAKYQKGDKQFDYNKLQPLAFPVALGASLNENKGDVLKSGQDAAASLFGMSTLKGIQDIFQPQFGGTSGEKTTGVGKRLIESFFKSFSPSLLAQEANRRDPVVREVPYNEDIWADLKGYFMSRTPELSKRLPERVTNLGDTKLKASGFTGAYLNPYRSEQAAYNPAATIISDLIEQTGDKALAPKPFDKSVDGRDSVTGQPVTKEIPKARYTQLEKQVGQIESKMIQKLPNNLTPEQKAYLVKKIYEFVRGAARQSVKKELGIIVE